MIRWEGVAEDREKKWQKMKIRRQGGSVLCNLHVVDLILGKVGKKGTKLDEARAKVVDLAAK